MAVRRERWKLRHTSDERTVLLAPPHSVSVMLRSVRCLCFSLSHDYFPSASFSLLSALTTCLTCILFRAPTFFLKIEAWVALPFCFEDVMTANRPVGAEELDADAEEATEPDVLRIGLKLFNRFVNLHSAEGTIFSITCHEPWPLIRFSHVPRINQLLQFLVRRILP